MEECKDGEREGEGGKRKPTSMIASPSGFSVMAGEGYSAVRVSGRGLVVG
jgi:hypothetical protein